MDTGLPAPRVRTFLFTDLERSTTLWDRHPAEMTQALQAHFDEITAAVEAHDGEVRAARRPGGGLAVTVRLSEADMR